MAIYHISCMGPRAAAVIRHNVIARTALTCALWDGSFVVSDGHRSTQQRRPLTHKKSREERGNFMVKRYPDENRDEGGGGGQEWEPWHFRDAFEVRSFGRNRVLFPIFNDGSVLSNILCVCPSPGSGLDCLPVQPRGPGVPFHSLKGGTYDDEVGKAGRVRFEI